MTLTVRLCRPDDDIWRVRAFLRDVYLLNDRRQRAWQAYRFDYWRCHGAANITHADLGQVVFLWENGDGRLAAVLNPEGDGEAFLHVHPAAASSALLEEMVAVAEDRLSAQGEAGSRLTVWANEHDAGLADLLAARGYTGGDGPEYQRRRLVAAPLPEVLKTPGYTIRSLGDDAELPARCYASGLAFHPDDLSCAEVNRANVSWYRNIQAAPLYRRDLDLVAVAEGGEVAAFCTVWFDDVTRTGSFEPVGTVPAHQRKGLASALMGEGLRRLARFGANLATVGSYGPRAGALYGARGFTDYEVSYPWERGL